MLRTIVRASEARYVEAPAVNFDDLTAEAREVFNFLHGHAFDYAAKGVDLWAAECYAIWYACTYVGQGGTEDVEDAPGHTLVHGEWMKANGFHGTDAR
jgi:hypothetical protein